MPQAQPVPGVVLPRERQLQTPGPSVIEKFDMDVKPVSLTAADVSDLLVAIAKDPGYAAPKPVKPRPPKPDHPATFLERRRARRERRRARWARASASSCCATLARST